MHLNTLFDHPAFVMACPLLLPKHLRHPNPDLEVQACVVKYRTDHPDYEGGWWLEVYVNDELVNDCSLDRPRLREWVVAGQVRPDSPLMAAELVAYRLLDDADPITEWHL